MPPVFAPRFSLGRAAGGSLAACLWLWTSAGALSGAASPEAVSTTAYRSALESFNRADYSRALTLLEQAPKAGSPGEQADVFNLRGAIYLRQNRYDQAQAEFSQASRADRTLWAARFNEAEVNFRQQRYAESCRQFAALLGQTSRLFHNEEHRFVQYKTLLAGVCAGDEKPALDYIAGHRDDAQPPLAWYYLNAALEHRHDHSLKAEQWLAQADAKFVAGSGQTYADSFDRLGWGSGHSAGGEARPEVRQVTIAENTVSKLVAPRPRPAAKAPEARILTNFRETAAEPVAKPGSRPGSSINLPPLSSAILSPADVPPVADEMLNTAQEIDRAENAPVHAPATLARPRKGRATPTPSPADGAAPTPTPGVSANQGGAATPAATSTATPSAEFTGKYEAAYVKFLEKNYPDTLSLLDEADKTQPGQLQSISLRFKCHYALAYLEYRKQNYPGALGELDQADQTQKNADSFNLRGLIFSKQRNYDQAEVMFRKSITTDQALWAAKFNYAELPFNRGNYTDARTRFEELFSQTDASKQPREAELTQYKVFLTLLLEGKVESASTFMDHLNFSGATPARYFCNAALNFRAGSVDKAKNWISDAKKEFPPQLVAIFIESFYRLGWMADPNLPGTALAQQSPVGTPAVTTSGTQPTTVATATATPSASPMVVAAASPTPTPVVVATPPPTPTPAVAAASASPRPAASIPPVVVPTPSVGPARPVVLASATPTPTPMASPAVVAVPTPSASPARTVVALASATPTPLASAPPVVVATPTASPVRSVALASASPRPTASIPAAVAVVTPTASPTPSLALATATPRPSASVPAVVAVVTPTVRPSPSLALATATPRPSASVPALVVLASPTATPTRSLAAASVPPTPATTPVTVRATPSPSPSVTPADEAASQETVEAKRKSNRRIFLLVIVLLQTLYYVKEMRRVYTKRQQSLLRAAARKREMLESSK